MDRCDIRATNPLGQGPKDLTSKLWLGCTSMRGSGWELTPEVGAKLMCLLVKAHQAARPDLKAGWCVSVGPVTIGMGGEIEVALSGTEGVIVKHPDTLEKSLTAVLTVTLGLGRTRRWDSIHNARELAELIRQKIG